MLPAPGMATVLFSRNGYGVGGTIGATIALITMDSSRIAGEAVLGEGLPLALAGVVIAALELAPESLAAYRASARNRIQTSLNLALGTGRTAILQGAVHLVILAVYMFTTVVP